MTTPKEHPKQESPCGRLVRYLSDRPPVGLPRCRDPFCYQNTRYGCLIGGCRLRGCMERVFALSALVALAVLVLTAGSLTTPHRDSYVEVAAVAREFAATHSYVLGEYDCDEASIDLANEYRARGYNATLMLGNPRKPATSIYQITHAWVLVQVHGQWIAVESTTGEQIPTDPLYYEGWPVQVDDYWTWVEVHLDPDRLRPVPAQFYPVPLGMP